MIGYSYAAEALTYLEDDNIFVSGFMNKPLRTQQVLELQAIVAAGKQASGARVPGV